LPLMKHVFKEGWDSENQFNENSGLYVSGGGENMSFHINCDNKYLLNEIHKKPEHKLIIMKCWEITLALMGLSKLNAYQKESQEKSVDINERIFEDTRDYSPILIPLVLRVSRLASSVHQQNKAA
jgi:hypothetical protein